MDPHLSRYYTFVKPILTNQKVKNYANLAFSIFTTIIFSFFAIRPTISTIIGLQKSIDEEKQILVSLEQKLVSIEEGRLNLNNIPNSTTQKMRSLLPDSPTIPSFVSFLNTIAKNVDASISGLQIQPTTLTSAADPKLPQVEKEIEFTFNVQTTYQKLEYILEAMFSSPRLIKITSLNITKLQDSNLATSISGRFYYLTNEEAPPTNPNAAPPPAINQTEPQLLK